MMSVDEERRISSKKYVFSVFANAIANFLVSPHIHAVFIVLACHLLVILNSVGPLPFTEILAIHTYIHKEYLYSAKNH